MDQILDVQYNLQVCKYVSDSESRIVFSGHGSKEVMNYCSRCLQTSRAKLVQSALSSVIFDFIRCLSFDTKLNHAVLLRIY